MTIPTTTPLDKAKDTLLRALDALEQAQQDLSQEPERVDLIVTYEMGIDLGDGGYESVGGWASTAGPKWLHAAMLRRAADAQDDAAIAHDDDEGDT